MINLTQIKSVCQKLKQKYFHLLTKNDDYNPRYINPDKIPTTPTYMWNEHDLVHQVYADLIQDVTYRIPMTHLHCEYDMDLNGETKKLDLVVLRSSNEVAMAIQFKYFHYDPENNPYKEATWNELLAEDWRILKGLKDQGKVVEICLIVGDLYFAKLQPGLIEKWLHQNCLLNGEENYYYFEMWQETKGK